jgi:nickel-dependent lactate racemase
VTAAHGYPVEVSRRVTDSDLTVYVNTNYIRGFTGGWKSVCIGLSTWKSIRVTHDPDGMSMSLHRNRMHAVLDGMGHHLEQRLGRRIFKIDTVLADPFHATHVFAGGVDETRRAAIDVQAQRFPARRDAAPEPVDILVYGVPDSSPYAIWAGLNPILTLISMGLGYLGGMIDAAGKPGCTVIMAAAVREAWDRVHHPSYPDVWERVLPETRDPYAITARWEQHFARHAEHIDAYRHRFAFHPIHGILATHPLKRLKRVGRVIVAGARDTHVPPHLGYEVAASVEDAIARAQQIHGRDARIGYVEQPPMPADPDR